MMLFIVCVIHPNDNAVNMARIGMSFSPKNIALKELYHSRKQDLTGFTV